MSRARYRGRIRETTTAAKFDIGSTHEIGANCGHDVDFRASSRHFSWDPNEKLANSKSLLAEDQQEQPQPLSDADHAEAA
jgi:hypothetical protein